MCSTCGCGSDEARVTTLDGTTDHHDHHHDEDEDAQDHHHEQHHEHPHDHPRSHTLELQVSTSTDSYTPNRGSAVVTLANGTVRVPALAPTG